MFLFCLNMNVHAEVEDTCKVRIEKFNNKPALVHIIFNALANKDFRELPHFCNSYVELSIIQGEKEFTEGSTEYKIIQSITDIFSKIDYVRFTIASGQTKNGEDLIVATIYQFEDKDDSSLNILFVLNHNCEINKIILF